MKIFTTKYQVKNPLLMPLVKYYWHLESYSPVSLQHKLLPVNNIDIILNLSTPIHYVTDDNLIKAASLHFNGIRNKYNFINQQGNISVMGISFFPYGIYPFLKTPVSEFTDHTVSLNEVVQEFASNIEAIFFRNLTTMQRIDIIENKLLLSIDFTRIDENLIKIFRSYFIETQNHNIKYFCQKFGIHIKQLERLFLKYIGLTPKALQNINRFQTISNQLIHSLNNKTFTSLALDYNYYDQTHFIKEFKKFSGCTPSQFVKERITVKETTEYLPPI